MAFSLQTITFNHDLNSASTSALNVRRNKDFEIAIPEYNAASPVPAEFSAAAYAIAETSGQNVVIRATFQAGVLDVGPFEVKAIGGGVLGAIDPAPVVIAPGGTVSVDLQLSHRTFNAVGVHNITWQWLYREGGGAWQNLVSTTHRIYILLAVPGGAWSQAAASKSNPWTELLDESCATASGTRSDKDAVKALTKRVNGAYQLRYDIVSGAPRYATSGVAPSFNLTNWINYVIKGAAPAMPVFCGGGADQYPDFKIVNCYDCAAALALMSQSIGAVSAYYFHGPFGYLNYIVAIGRGKCNNPFFGCGGGADAALGPDDPRSGFGNHAYTKLGGTRNYDACMREWLAPGVAAILVLLWLLLLIITFGALNMTSLLDRAGGWLVDLDQNTYNARTIDTSTPWEASAAGGAPVVQTLSIITA